MRKLFAEYNVLAIEELLVNVEQDLVLIQVWTEACHVFLVGQVYLVNHFLADHQILLIQSFLRALIIERARRHDIQT